MLNQSYYLMSYFQNKKNYGLLEAQSQRLIEQYDLEAETQRQIRDDDRKSIEESPLGS